MGWGAMSVVDHRREFVGLSAAQGTNFRELCRRFGVSPKTGYKWVARFAAGGEAGLTDRSRRPLTSSARSPDAVEAAVLGLRERHPAWGGRKLAAVLARQGEAPSPSTVTAILRRHGVALGAFGGGAAPFLRFEHEAPNDLWQMDFKGHVALRQGRLHPLTVLDDHARFALVTGACADQTTATVKACLVTAFRRYGLPLRIMTDNGSPWGSATGSTFTPLGVFLVEQGIRIGHSRPFHPQTQGKDERFHRRVKAEVLSGPPFADLTEAARALDRWRDIYNTERPHEALGLAVPLSRYRPSPRAFRETIEPFDYAPDDIPRRVQQGGRITFKGRSYRLPKAFKDHTIALRPTATDGTFDAYFRHQFIEKLDIATPA